MIYTGIIIIDTGMHQILKITKYTSMLRNSSFDDILFVNYTAQKNTIDFYY